MIVFERADPPHAGRLRASGAGAGLAGRGGPARARAARAPRAPRAALLHAVRGQPRPVRVRTRTQGNIQQVILMSINNHRNSMQR